MTALLLKLDFMQRIARGKHALAEEQGQHRDPSTSINLNCQGQKYRDAHDFNNFRTAP